MSICSASADYCLLREVVWSKGRQFQGQPKVSMSCVVLQYLSDWLCIGVGLFFIAVVVIVSVNL